MGGKNFTEQLILSSMTTQYLQAHGYEVDQRAGMGTTVLRRAQESGQVDLYWEYTGTSLISYNKVTEDLSPEATYERVKELVCFRVTRKAARTPGDEPGRDVS